MYDVIYDEMIDSRIAVTIKDKLYFDKEGDEVNEDKAYVKEIDAKLKHPNYLIFYDETGCNTSQKKDGHKGGRKLFVERGTVPQMLCSTRWDENDIYYMYIYHYYMILTFIYCAIEVIVNLIYFHSHMHQEKLFVVSLYFNRRMELSHIYGRRDKTFVFQTSVAPTVRLT